VTPLDHNHTTVIAFQDQDLFRSVIKLSNTICIAGSFSDFLFGEQEIKNSKEAEIHIEEKKT